MAKIHGHPFHPPLRVLNDKGTQQRALPSGRFELPDATGFREAYLGSGSWVEALMSNGSGVLAENGPRFGRFDFKTNTIEVWRYGEILQNGRPHMGWWREAVPVPRIWNDGVPFGPDSYAYPEEEIGYAKSAVIACFLAALRSIADAVKSGKTTAEDSGLTPDWHVGLLLAFSIALAKAGDWKRAKDALRLAEEIMAQLAEIRTLEAVDSREDGR